MLANYLLRATLTATSALARPRIGLLDEARLPFMAGISDVDWNGHVNNGRYLTLMDHGRLDYIVRTGLIGAMIKTRCQPVVAEASIRFRREVFPYVPLTLLTRVRAWDDKRLYIVQRMERKGELLAEAEVELAVRAGGKTISIAEMLKRAGREVPSDFLRARLLSPAVANRY